jgi:glycolate oxidase
LLELTFEDLITATIVLPNILSFSPAAVEMLDHTAIPSQNNAAARGMSVICGICKRRFETSREGYPSVRTRSSHIVRLSRRSIDRIWAARKGALNNIMRITVRSRRPIGLIEDTAVKTSFLPDYVL